MSIAWGSLVLLILLLPGILFFVGALFPEQFTRDAEQRSPLGQLGGTLFIAFFVHGALYATLTTFCGGWLPCISIEALLVAINATPEFPGAIEATARMLAMYRWAIVGYAFLTCIMGIGAGYLYGRLVSSKKISALTRHPWIYDLGADGLTYAYVMTHVRQEERVLMYKGFLKAAGLRVDGRFSYLILRDVTRYYMSLETEAPRTSAAEHHKRIGESQRPGDDPSRPNHDAIASSRSLFIEGEDIANAMFEKLSVKRSKDLFDFAKIVEEERKLIQDSIAELVAKGGGIVPPFPPPKRRHR